MTGAECARFHSGMHKSLKTHVDMIADELTDDMFNRNFQMLLVIPLLVLHDKYGWGKKRLTVFFKLLTKTIEMFTEQHYNIDDVIGTLNNETGIGLKKVRDDGFELIELEEAS